MSNRKRKVVNINTGNVSFAGGQHNFNGDIEGDVVFNDYVRAKFEEPFTASITVKLSKTQADMVRAIAQARFQDTSEFIREVLDQQILRYLGR